MHEPLTTADSVNIGELAGEVSAAAVVALRKAWRAGRDAGATEMCDTATMVHLAHEQPIRAAAAKVLAVYTDNVDCLGDLRDALVGLWESLNPAPTGEQISLQDVARMRQALLWIEPVCERYTSGNCYQPGCTPDAKYYDDKWCDGCISAYGLGTDPDRGHQTGGNRA